MTISQTTPFNSRVLQAGVYPTLKEKIGINLYPLLGTESLLCERRADRLNTELFCSTAVHSISILAKLIKNASLYLLSYL